jgi:hypothetical protein
MLGTAFVFSWEENWGTAQPSKCRIRTPTTSPSERHSYTTNSPFRALPRVPHLRAALAAQPQHIPYTDRAPYQVTSRAEACMVTRTYDFHLPSQTSEQVIATFPQNAAPVRGLSNFGSTCSRPRQISLPSYKTCRGVLNYPRTRLVTDPLKPKNSPFLTSSAVPHASAGPRTRSQHVPHLFRYPYPVTRHAETCTVARVQHSSHSSSNLEQLVPTFLQRAALFCTLSNAIQTEHKPQQPILSSYKAHRNVLDSSRSQSVLYSFRTKDSSPLAFLMAPHASASLVIQSQHISYPDCQPYQLTRCAEICTVACAQDLHLTPQSEEQVTTTFLKVAAPARGLKDLVPTYPRSGLAFLLNFATCKCGHDRSRAWPALYLLRARINLVQVFLRMPHLHADPVNQPEHVPYLDH